MPPTYSLFIDVINNSRVSGWCFCNDSPENPQKILFYTDDEEIGVTKAHHYRPDLKALNFHATGMCGFEFSIPNAVQLHQYERFEIHVPDMPDPLKVFYTKEIPAVLRDPLPRVFFMHIPKTAGTSFNTLATTIFPQNAAAVHLEAPLCQDSCRLFLKSCV